MVTLLENHLACWNRTSPLLEINSDALDALAAETPTYLGHKKGQREKEIHTCGRMATSQSTINKLALPAGILLLTAAISPISQLTLAPVYGSLPSSQMHGLMIAITFSLGTLLHRFRGRASHWILRGLPVWAAWIPLIQCLILPYSKALGPVYGPIVNGLLSCHALLIPSAYALGRPMDGVELGMLDKLPGG